MELDQVAAYDSRTAITFFLLGVGAGALMALSLSPRPIRLLNRDVLGAEMRRDLTPPERD
jgi:hypothetical protein